MYHNLAQTEHMMYHHDRMHTLGEMMSGIGHELNQPLTAIQYYADELALEAATQHAQHSRHSNRVKPHHRTNRHQSPHHSRHPSMGKNAASAAGERVNVRQLLTEVQQFVAWQHQDLPLLLQCEAHISLKTEPLKLKQILVNCILNSIQSRRQQRCTLEAFTGCISIIDNGKGFDQEQLDFPFVPFRTGRSDGLGFGLGRADASPTACTCACTYTTTAKAVPW